MNKRIALVLPAIVDEAPYIRDYIKILQKSNIDFIIIEWSRLNFKSSPLCFYTKLFKVPFLGGLISYLMFSRFVVLCLKKNNIDKCIIFTLPILFFMHLSLLRLKYVVDIRDYANLLNNYFCKWFIFKLLRRADKVVISSPGFLQWLPKNIDYLLNHNLSSSDFFKFIKNNNRKLSCDSIKICTIGMIRDYDINKSLIDSLIYYGNYNLCFIGSSSIASKLNDYCILNNYSVRFTGKYIKNDEINLVSDFDFINLLTSRNVLGSYLLTNRLYLCVLLGIPCLVFNNTTQADFVKKYNLGLVIDNVCSLNNEIINYIDSFSIIDFDKGRASFMKQIILDYNNFERYIVEFIQ